MAAEPLSLPEREEIRAGITAGDTLTAIAQRLGRHRSTISEEVNRNGGREAYRAAAAEARALTQRARPKQPKLRGDPELAWHVTKRLMARDSPMTISIELARGTHGITASISHECIYQGVYAHGTRGLRAGLHKGLHRKRRCRKRGHAPGEAPARASPLGLFTPISARPEIASGRSEVGHLEGDLICGAFNRTAIVTVFDRASRKVFLAGFTGRHDADATLEALEQTLARIPAELRRSLTWDQGSEIARHAALAESCGIDIYIADAHSPWQRPTNENGNGLLRRYLPKSTDLSIHTPDDLRRIEHRLNTMPRRSLHWSTANTLYDAAVASTG